MKRVQRLVRKAVGGFARIQSEAPAVLQLRLRPCAFDLACLILSTLLPATVATADVLSVVPGEIRLVGHRAHQQVLVSSIFEDGRQADLTREVSYECLNTDIAAVDAAGVVRPRGNGTTHITIRSTDATIAVPITVSEFDEVAAIDFRTEVVPALSRGGCSQGACHGSPQGKNGFRLSLRGFDPSVDIHSLTREGAGRRLNQFDPEASLILQKPGGQIAHAGGVRLRKKDGAYKLLLQWISEGSREQQAPPQLTRLEVFPRTALLHESHPQQQLIAMAHFDNGTVRDVSDVVVFSAASEDVAEVSQEGRVEFQRTGEAAVLVRYQDRIETARLAYVDRDSEFEFASPAEANYIDQLVFAKQRLLQLRPAKVADDATFLRRVYLDLIGSIPTPSEAQRFFDSADPEKRGKLIDELLEREEYALFWALKWADVMRGNRQTISHRGVHNFHRYLVRSIAADRPFDKLANEIVTSIGNTIHEPAANFYRISRTPIDAAESFSQLFLGVRIQCAKCHNHPYESITQQDYYGLAATFSRVRIKGTRFGIDDEVVVLAESGELKMPGASEPIAPIAFGSLLEAKGEDNDHRELLAAWLTSPKNRYFARSTVNRIWSHLMGRGLVDPIDDFRDSNPPSNPELLDALADDFSENSFRFKPIIRSILNSHTYQLAAQLEQPQSPKAADEEQYFTHAVIHMLSAEQIIDAISTATGIPESFPGYPQGTRAIALAEGNIDHKFLQAFTKPIRDVQCDCARETEPSLNQVVHLLNNPDILGKVDSPKSRIARWTDEGKSLGELIEMLYLATLSRRPNCDELQFSLGYLTASEATESGLQDLQHALLNSNEFLLRH
ncbi:MAG: hypothetical protein CMJ64_14275 [Planctomycetaceae bacterium]|nr:hypothetical protein [Planctomycetaceae bacterium]